MRPVVFNLCVVNRETGGVPVGIGCDHGGQRPAAEMVRHARLCPDTQAVRVGVGMRLADRRHVIRDAVTLCTESLVVYQAVFEIHGYLLLNARSLVFPTAISHTALSDHSHERNPIATTRLCFFNVHFNHLSRLVRQFLSRRFEHLACER